MDYRNFSPGKYYCDESLQPQGPRRLKTSTPHGRRPNPYQRSPEAGPGGAVSPPSEGQRNRNWRNSNDSWRSRDSSRNSSFNSSFNSPGGKSFSPGGFQQRYHKGFRRDQDFNTKRNMAAYYHPSMTQNPWLELEQSNIPSPESSPKQLNISGSSDTDILEFSEGDKMQDVSDSETHSPDILVKSIREYSYGGSRDDTNASDLSNSQNSVC